MTNALVEQDVEDPGGGKEKRSRKRSIEEGRITTLGTPELGRCVVSLAAEAGIMPTTFARMLLVEALKARGWTMKRINEEFADGPTAQGDPREVREAVPAHRKIPSA